MTPGVDLLASYGTISAGVPRTDREYSLFDFKDRVESAARAGFKGFGIWHADLEHVLEKYSLKEMKRIFEDGGIQHVELEFLTDWFLAGNRKNYRTFENETYSKPPKCWVRVISRSAISFRNHALCRLIDAFAILCEQAAQHGTRIGFELIPFAMIRTLEESLKMVKGAAAANGGIVFDLWHVVKLGISYEKIALAMTQP